MNLRLHIGNKNYSSWSLRPWLLMKCLNIPFIEVHHEFGQGNFAEFSPSSQVPCLEYDGHHMIWDSLAITEFLAEEHEAVWPMDKKERSHARSACCEMHSGFKQIRAVCPMNLAIVATLKNEETITKDLARLNDLLGGLLTKSGGPFLFGKKFCAADAFYAPVAFRWQSYGFTVSSQVETYFKVLLELPAMKEWFSKAITETYVDPVEEPGDDKHLKVDFRKK